MKSGSGEYTHENPWPGDPARFRSQATGGGNSVCQSARLGEQRKARVAMRPGTTAMAPTAEGMAPMSAAEMEKAESTAADCKGVGARWRLSGY